jgi:hypothetical protein
VSIPSSTPSALARAIACLLRPLCRLMLRHGMPFGVFEELAKRTYVEVALAEFGLPGKKPSVSRVSILSGLTRKEVQRLVSTPAPDDTSDAGASYNRAARVLTGWVRDPDFHGADGAPRLLHAEGEGSFATLVKRHSGDVPARAVLDELLRVGAVRRADDGRIALLTRAYVPQHGADDKLHILGTDVADLIRTIDHNLTPSAIPPRFQRKVMYHGIPAASVAAFRALSASESQALLERLDAWLAAHDIPNPAHQPDLPRVRVGVGIHAFEEPMVPRSPNESAPS